MFSSLCEGRVTSWCLPKFPTYLIWYVNLDVELYIQNLSRVKIITLSLFFLFSICYFISKFYIFLSREFKYSPFHIFFISEFVALDYLRISKATFDFGDLELDFSDARGLSALKEVRRGRLRSSNLNFCHWRILA